MPKPKLSELKQTHGKAEKPTYQTLDQIMGDSGVSEYGTLDEREYEQKIRELNTHDLHEHAIDHMVLPNDNRDRLIKTLMEEFRSYAARYQTSNQRNAKGVKTLTKDAQAILAEGR